MGPATPLSDLRNALTPPSLIAALFFGFMSAMKVIDVAAALIFDHGKLLITQRRPDDHLPNLWEFPGGKVEPGETFQACLVREIAEELDVEITVGEMLEEITHSYPEKTVRLCFYNCRLISGEPKAIHVQAWKWVTREELRREEFPAADAKLIDRLASGELWRGQGT